MKKKRILTAKQKARQVSYSTAWRVKNPEKYKEYQRKYQKRWRKLHPDYFKEWHAANRGHVTETKRRYRARKGKQ